MENKEKDLYLAKLLEKNAIKQDEFEDIEYKPEINAFDSKYLKQSFVDKINFGWSVWQAKATPEGFVLVADNSKTVVAIEKMVEQQVEASGITQDISRLDGHRILEAMIEAQEQSHD
ncbi:hypothetical protein [Acinetobacter guillouiae]|uniref:hypothetical protein n=1 Tax=Acinetobacter guillouiae TaxID=106649 RepID=UPI002FDB566F